MIQINPRKKVKAYSVTQEKALFLRDMPRAAANIQSNIQLNLNDVAGLFMTTFAKIYSAEPLSDENRAKMRKYLEKIFEAKDAVSMR